VRFHVVSLPHTETTSEFSWCAYTTKVKNFATMMNRLGHAVYLYCGEKNEAECTAWTNCATRNPLQATDALPDFNPADEWFLEFNRNVVADMRLKIEPQDFICLIGGTAQQPIAQAFPENMSVEFGIGYGGTFSPYRVFESYAWMHMVYGNSKTVHDVDGSFFDRVIPNYFDPDLFPLGTHDGDYYLYLGRLIDRKGWRLAQEVCEHLGLRFVVAGPGHFSGYGEYLGTLGPQERAEVIGKALAVFTPTLYVEPFCGVHVEALLCGTPVITTDFGVFTETVYQGVNGWRCRSFREFCEATKQTAAPSGRIREDAMAQYSMDNVAYQYEEYFDHLMTLWGSGFYA
jgi:glycosyltransferase involved in cell wall biosynthesis